MCACVRACVRACVFVHVRAHTHTHTHTHTSKMVGQTSIVFTKSCTTTLHRVVCVCVCGGGGGIVGLVCVCVRARARDVPLRQFYDFIWLRDREFNEFGDFDQSNSRIAQILPIKFENFPP